MENIPFRVGQMASIRYVPRDVAAKRYAVPAGVVATLGDALDQVPDVYAAEEARVERRAE